MHMCVYCKFYKWILYLIFAKFAICKKPKQNTLIYTHGILFIFHHSREEEEEEEEAGKLP